MEPIVFQPIYKERVWGGRSLEEIYDRQLPDSKTPYGESWEMTDRGADQSIVKGGAFDGKTLNDLWNVNREEVFGKEMPDTDRFPLLIKILDAQKDLSVQVHPPADLAQELGGEPKTEMWYIADVKDGGKLYVGVKEGVTAESFKSAIERGAVEESIHVISPKKGDFIHIESGRLHAIGAGLLIYEIQQNSDTTYRVFDWNRLGLSGKPRELHVKESLQCIDFTDIEPLMGADNGSLLSSCPYFKVDRYEAKRGQKITQKNRERFAIITVVEGVLKSNEGAHFKAGDFFLLPINASPLKVEGNVVYLETTIPITAQ